MPKQTPVPPMEQLVIQVKITNTLLAAQLLQHMTQQDVIALLKSVGASHHDIASIVGTSYATVAVSLGRARKQKRKEGQDAAAQAANAPGADLRDEGDRHE